MISLRKTSVSEPHGSADGIERIGRDMTTIVIALVLAVAVTLVIADDRTPDHLMITDQYTADPVDAGSDRKPDSATVSHRGIDTSLSRDISAVKQKALLTALLISALRAERETVSVN